MKIPLPDEHAKALTFQRYDPQPAIDGVFYHPLKKHHALEGWFMEYLRLTGGAAEGLPAEFEVRQISFSEAVGGRINAFHLHPKEIQDEMWCVVRGKMMVWLVDVRAGSATVDVKRKFLLSCEQPGMLYIPSGVAHGYKAGADGAMLVYVMNNQFQLDDPNEGRLPWDHFGAEIWEEDRG